MALYEPLTIKIKKNQKKRIKRNQKKNQKEPQAAAEKSDCRFLFFFFFLKRGKKPHLFALRGLTCSILAPVTKKHDKTSKSTVQGRYRQATKTGANKKLVKNPKKKKPHKTTPQPEKKP